MIRLCKVLRSDLSQNSEKELNQVLIDWGRDSEGNQYMELDKFTTSLFELVDLW